jgi:hypothetical protein
MSRVFTLLDYVLIPLDVIRIVVAVSFAVITLVIIRASNSCFAVRRIAEDRLPGFAMRTGYNEVPLERLTVV